MELHFVMPSFIVWQQWRATETSLTPVFLSVSFTESTFFQAHVSCMNFHEVIHRLYDYDMWANPETSLTGFSILGQSDSALNSQE